MFNLKTFNYLFIFLIFSDKNFNNSLLLPFFGECKDTVIHLYQTNKIQYCTANVKKISHKILFIRNLHRKNSYPQNQRILFYPLLTVI